MTCNIVEPSLLELNSLHAFIHVYYVRRGRTFFVACVLAECAFEFKSADDFSDSLRAMCQRELLTEQ
jgi:hypothetical protein